MHKMKMSIIILILVYKNSTGPDTYAVSKLQCLKALMCYADEQLNTYQ